MKEIKELEKKVKLNDINIKINHLLPLYSLFSYLFMRVNGNFEIFGIELNETNVTIGVSLIGVAIYMKDIIYAATELSKKILGLKK